MVKTKIIRETTEIPVYYGMVKQNGLWKVYDVKIEGISFVVNYKKQFRSYLRKNSSTQLIELLKQKIEAQKGEHAL